MKKQLILLGLLLMVLCGFAQNHWFKTIESPYYQKSGSDIFIIGQQYYFTIIEEYNDQGFEEYYTRLCKISPKGEVECLEP
jgi:hypothetical protein